MNLGQAKNQPIEASMAATTIQRLVDIIINSLKSLGTQIPDSQIESMAILIHESMSQPNRRFHTTDHVFDVMKHGGPAHELAAIFHDVVYYQVDGGLTEDIRAILGPYIEEEMQQVFVARKVSISDNSFWIAAHVFGFRLGQSLLPFHGMNEFLSCLVALKCLDKYLGVKDLLTIACCIEASIPFRGKDVMGKTSYDHLKARLIDFGKSHHMSFEIGEIDETIKTAIRFANQDVANFSEKETAFFLDNTWKLLPENNPGTVGRGMYTVKKYRQALQKMEAFFSGIDTNLIFHKYQDEPSDEAYDLLKKQANRNVELGRLYLGGRLLSTSILEALSEVSGGDAPVAMFVGGNSKVHGDSRRDFDSLLPIIHLTKLDDIDPDLLHLFEYEVNASALLDFRRSALAAYVYRSLGTTRMNECIANAKKYFSREISAEQFLELLGKSLVGPVAAAAGQMISTRREILLKYSA